MAVVQQLANISTAAAHLIEPRLYELSQLIRRGKPALGVWVSLNSAWKAKEIAHHPSRLTPPPAPHSPADAPRQQASWRKPPAMGARLH